MGQDVLDLEITKKSLYNNDNIAKDRKTIHWIILNTIPVGKNVKPLCQYLNLNDWKRFIDNAGIIIGQRYMFEVNNAIVVYWCLKKESIASIDLYSD